MGYASLPLKAQNDFGSYFEDQRYTYLVINKVEKPTRRSKKTEDDYNKWEEQQETLKRLETGHYNCYNRPIAPTGIDETIAYIVEDFNKYIIYKIKPTSCKRENQGYYSGDRYYFYEFDVVNKFDTLADLYQSFMDNYIFERVFAKLIDSFKYGDNVKKWNDILEDIKKAVPTMSEHLWLTDVSQWINKDVSFYDNKDDMLLSLLENGDMQVTSKYEINKFNNYLQRFMRLHLYKCLLYYTKEKMKTEEIKLDDTSISFLQQNSDNPDVAELVKILNPKMPGIKLIITKTVYYDDGYASHESKEEIDVKDSNEAKKYILRNFDIDFSEMQQNIDNIYFSDGDEEYRFKLLTK